LLHDNLYVALLKHVNNTDVAIEVLKSFYIKEKQEYSLKVAWWRVSRVNPPRPMYITQRIRIPRKKLHKEWLPYEFIGKG
jgi:hypothetical protein